MAVESQPVNETFGLRLNKKMYGKLAAFIAQIELGHTGKRCRHLTKGHSCSTPFARLTEVLRLKLQT
jgi:hypothetical protein